MDDVRRILTGHKSLLVGVANDQSISYGCAEAFRTAGADLAITWLNDKTRAYVEPLGQRLDAEIMAPLNVESSGEPGNSLPILSVSGQGCTDADGIFNQFELPAKARCQKHVNSIATSVPIGSGAGQAPICDGCSGG